MTDLVAGVAVVLGTGVVLAGLTWLAMRVRRNGTAGPAIGAAMAAYDEAVHVTAYDTFAELQAQDERAVPIVSSDDR